MKIIHVNQNIKATISPLSVAVFRTGIRENYMLFRVHQHRISIDHYFY